MNIKTPFIIISRVTTVGVGTSDVTYTSADLSISLSGVLWKMAD